MRAGARRRPIRAPKGAHRRESGASGSPVGRPVPVAPRPIGEERIGVGEEGTPARGGGRGGGRGPRWWRRGWHVPWRRRQGGGRGGGRRHRQARNGDGGGWGRRQGRGTGEGVSGPRHGHDAPATTGRVVGGGWAQRRGSGWGQRKGRRAPAPAPAPAAPDTATPPTAVAAAVAMHAPPTSRCSRPAWGWGDPRRHGHTRPRTARPRAAPAPAAPTLRTAGATGRSLSQKKQKSQGGKQGHEKKKNNETRRKGSRDHQPALQPSPGGNLSADVPRPPRTAGRDDAGVGRPALPWRPRSAPHVPAAGERPARPDGHIAQTLPLVGSRAGARRGGSGGGGGGRRLFRSPAAGGEERDQGRRGVTAHALGRMQRPLRAGGTWQTRLWSGEDLQVPQQTTWLHKPLP